MRRAIVAVFLPFIFSSHYSVAQDRPAFQADHQHARPASRPHHRATAVALTPATVNSAQFTGDINNGNKPNPVMLRLQILLDRAYFSPGEIDGGGGENTVRALSGFQAEHHLPATGRLDAATWAELLKTYSGPVLAPYTITAADVKGPFVKQIPHNLDQQAHLPCLCYTSPLEALAEKFHSSPKLLQLLNPGKQFNHAGEQVVVPVVSGGPPVKEVARVTVSKSAHVVRAYNAADKLVAQYPATMGSVHDPLPIGQWTITGVDKHPVFHYNPDLFWDAKPDDTRATLPKGPNNPVGVVWMNLSKPHYGIHGTPEPSKIGKTQSHGCIRLTNWDAWNLAQMVQPGTPAILQE